METLSKRPVNQDGLIHEIPEKGFIAMVSPYDPSPSIEIENGVVVELDGKKRSDFDFIDFFIADRCIDPKIAKESMAIPNVEIARMLVDIHIERTKIIELAKGLTPAKLTRVMENLNVVEMMMAMQKMRSRSHPANQAHITNVKDNPILIAADGAEGALRGFREEETTVGVARYAPLAAIGLLVGSQIGSRGVMTQCAVEEAVELSLGMRGLTTYAETISVYGTEKVFIDGDDTPYSKAFLASAYASRGLKMRFTSGTGSEVLMANAEKKSMLYLETRCLFMTRGAGVQGIQNGSVSCVGITASVPSGVRAILAENLIAAILDLEVASSNDQTFSHSDIRRTARMLMQMLPGTDFIFSGYAGTPNCDNMFAGSNFDAEDFDDYNILQRDLKVDGGLRPVREDEVLQVRNKAARAMQVIMNAMGLPVSDEEVEAVTYAHSSADVPNRDVYRDLAAIEDFMKKGLTGIDIIKILHQRGFSDVAESLLQMLKQRMSGDYLHTAAILDTNFNVQSAINFKNTYKGPGTGYQMSDTRWDEIKNIQNVSEPEAVAGAAFLRELGAAEKSQNPKEVVIGLGPGFGITVQETMNGLAHRQVLKEIMAGIEEEGLVPRLVRIRQSSDVAFVGSLASKLSGSGVAIGLQSKGTAVIHHKDLYPLTNLELFPQAPLLSLETYRGMGKNAAKYAKGEGVTPLPTQNDPMSRPKYQVKAALLHMVETEGVDGSKPVNLELLTAGNETQSIKSEEIESEAMRNKSMRSEFLLSESMRNQYATSQSKETWERGVHS